MGGSTRAFVGIAAVLTFSLAQLLCSGTRAAAVVEGGCKAQATGSKSGTVDLTTATVWHLKTDDVVSGSGTAPTEQTAVGVGAYAFGLVVPLVNSTGKGTSGSAGPYVVADYSRYARVIAVSGTSNSCSGYVTVIIDDVDPLTTAAGIGGLAAAIVGLLGMLVATRGGGVGARIGGGLSGLIAGAGVGILLSQLGSLDLRDPIGLALPVGGLVLGVAIAGLLRKK